MNFNVYQSLALMTESKIKKVEANRVALMAILSMSIATTEIADLAKKNIFYGREFDKVKFDKLVAEVQSMSSILASLDITTAEKEPIKVPPRMFHGIIGKFTESGELLAALEEHIATGDPFDWANLREELGDDAWYNAIICDVATIDMGDTLDVNIAKLKARYGDKFSKEAAVNRDLITERAILEGKAE